MQDRHRRLLMRDQLRLVVQSDDQLAKIKTVIGIDDHSDGQHADVRQNIKQIGGFRTHPLLRNDWKPRDQAKATTTLAVVVTIKYGETRFGSQSVAP
jgi:hypothetical protein